jgi:hypothetical protein
MSTYTSIQAFEMFIQGRRLRRKGWGDTYAKIAYNKVDGVTHRFIEQVKDIKGAIYTTSLSMTDLLCDDWEIAPNEIPCPCCKTIVKRW